jgi:flagellar assembly factor FliW
MNAVAVAIPPAPDEVLVHSALLGPLAPSAAQVFTFERGILGFPEARGFCLLPARQEGLFWLQSVDFEALTFLLVDPFPRVEGYSIEIDAAELGRTDAVDPSDILVLAIVTLPREPGQPATANLQGPLAFDLERRTGRQVVLQDTAYGVRHPVDLVEGSP